MASSRPARVASVELRSPAIGGPGAIRVTFEAHRLADLVMQQLPGTFDRGPDVRVEATRSNPRGAAARAALLRREKTDDTIGRTMFRHLGDGRIQVGIRPPLLYLDHCAVRRISDDPMKAGRLKMVFENRGTLMFSIVNMLEMARNSARSHESIRDMLDRLGPFWVPSDIDPGRVEQREKAMRCRVRSTLAALC